MLSKFEAALAEPNSALSTLRQHSWIRLIKAIGYEAALFDRAVDILARFSASEPEGNNLSSARNLFGEFFNIYLSGTQATPAQRRTAIRRLAASSDERLRASVQIALRSLIKSGQFMSSSGYDFGARSRDWGWHPRIDKDIGDWFEEAIKLVVELVPQPEARSLLANEFRGLWRFPGCRDALDRIAADLARTLPWIEGWIAARSTLRFDSKDMPEDVRSKLAQMIDRLKPSDLLNRARAVVLKRAHGGWDFGDGEECSNDTVSAWKKADKLAQEIGRALANDSLARHEFLPELLTDQQAQRAYECGRGLAEGTNDLTALWLELRTAYEIAESTKRSATVLGGFIFEAQRREPSFTSCTLESASSDLKLLPIVPYLQARAGLDTQGIERLRKAISRGDLAAQHFHYIANGSVSESPEEPLAMLLKDIAALPDGVEVALEILHMYFFSHDRNKETPYNAHLVCVGRELLVHVNFKRENPLRDYSTGHVINICLAGEEGHSAAREVCRHVYFALDSYMVWSHNLTETLKALFAVQPFIALGTFLLQTSSREPRNVFGMSPYRESPLESLDLAILQEWANIDPALRYPALGRCISMFATKNGDEENVLSPRFASLLEKAPHKRLFIGELWERLHPRSWRGSLADILSKRKDQLTRLAENSDEQVCAWVNEVIPELDRWIELERGRDRATEESFE